MPVSFDDIFGSSAPSPASQGGGRLSFDDIFGGPSATAVADPPPFQQGSQQPQNFDQYAGYDSGFDAAGQSTAPTGRVVGDVLSDTFGSVVHAPQELMGAVGSFLPKSRVAGVADVAFMTAEPMPGIPDTTLARVASSTPGDTALNPQSEAKPFFGAGGQVDQLDAQNAARDKFVAQKFQEIVAKPLDKLTTDDLSTYYGSLPVPMPKEVRTDPRLQDIYAQINEMYTGEPTIKWLPPTSKHPDGTPYRDRTKEQVDAERARMMQAGSDPETWVAQVRASMGGPTAFEDHNSLLQGLVGSVEGGMNAIKGELTGDLSGAKQKMAIDQWREQIESIKDAKSFWPKGREYARAIFQTTGQMAPSLLASYMTGNPEVGIYMMGGQAGLDDFGQKRAQGWSVIGAALHGTVTGVIEAGSELAGVKVGGALGLETGEAAAGHGFAQATEEAASHSIFKGVKDATVRKTLETMGSMALEGSEETLADVMHSVQDYIANTPGDGVQLKSFIVGAIMGGAGQVPSWASFLVNPTARAAREAGIPQAAAPRQADLAVIADAAKEAVAERAAGEVASGVENGRWQKVAESIDAAFDKYGGKIVRPIEQGYNAVASAVVESPPIKSIMDRILGDPEAKAAAKAKIAPQVAPIQSESPATPQPTPTSPVDATVPPTTSEPSQASEAIPGVPPESASPTGNQLPDETGGTTGLRNLGGKAAVDNMYDAMLQRMKAGKSPEPNTDPSRPPMLEQLWSVVQKKGLATPEEFIDAIRKAQPKTPEDYSRILDSFAARSMGQLGSALTKQLEGQADAARGIIPGQFANVTTEDAAQYADRKAKPTDASVERGKANIADMFRRAPTELGDNPAAIADWVRKGFDDNLYWRYLRESGQTLEQAIDTAKQPSTAPPATEAPPPPSVAPPVSPASEQSAPAGSGVESPLTEAQRGMLHDLGYGDSAIDAMPRREAIGNIRGKRKAPAAPLTADVFRDQLHAAATSPEEADALYGLVEARAEATGQSVDAYVGKRIKAVERAPQETSVALKQGAMPKGRKPRGEIVFAAADEGRAIVRAFEGAQDQSTLVHELGHLFRRDLAGADLKAAASWAGAKGETWSRAAEEKFARGFERFLRDGKSPTPRLTKIFQQFKTWLSSVYARVKGSPLDVKIPAEMRSVYDRLFTAPPTQESTNGAQVKTQTEAETQGREGLLATTVASSESSGSVEAAAPSSGLNAQESVALEAANKGPQLQPTPAQQYAATPKSQRSIITNIAKGLGIPIRFGRLTNRKAGGHYLPVADLIASAKANDIPVVAHETGHKLDQMFGLSKDPAVRSEIEVLGNPNTPNSRSSWTKSMSKGRLRAEGLAEFVRYWLTDPAHASKVAPNTAKAFEQVLDANADLGNTMRQAQEDIRLWKTAEPQARLRSQISRGEDPTKTRYSFNQLMRDVVDDLHYLKLASEDAKLARPDLAASRNPYILARNLRGSYGMAETFIRNGTVDFRTKSVQIGESLEDALKPVAGRVRDFGDWIVAKRAQELHSQGRETGLIPSDVDAVVKQYDSDHAFQSAFAAVKKWNDAVLKYSVDSGLVTPESAKAMRAMNQDYVPFHRLFEVGANEPTSQEATGKGSGLNPGKPGSLKKLKGSQRNIVDPIETMVRNAYSIVTASEKSAISNAVADLAVLPGMGKWVERVAAPTAETKFPVARIRDQLENLGADLSNVADDELLAFYKKASNPIFGENTIRVIRGGQPEFYRLNRYLHDTFLALDLDDAGKLIRILSSPAQLLRAGVTLEPSFNIANVIRDTFGAAVLSKHGALPFETTMRGLGALIGKPQLVAEWAASGGKSSVEANYFDRKALQGYIAEKVAKELTPGERAMIWGKSPLTLLRFMSGTFEEATRIGEYDIAFKALTASGMPEGDARRQAAFEARDRQDFAKGGAKTKILRHMTAFWNANLQANVRLAQAFKERPAQTLLAGLAFVTLPKLLEQALNWDDKDYWARPQWERDAFFMIPHGKDEAGHTRFIRVPTPFEIGILFGTLPGRMLQYAHDKDPEAMTSYPKQVLQQAAPNPLPQTIQLVFEAALSGPQGWSVFRDRPIVPDRLADLPPDLQWTDQTSSLAKKVGETMGVSPMKVDHVIDSMTGGLGKVLSGRQIPGQRFVTNPLAVSNQAFDDFYKIAGQLDQEQARYQQTGEETGFGPVMRTTFQKASHEMAVLRDKARAETDPIKKAKLEDNAFQIANDTVQKFKANPQPDDAVLETATKRIDAMFQGHPERKKEKGKFTESVEDYNARVADWQAASDKALAWLTAHKDSSIIQQAKKDVLGSDSFKNAIKVPASGILKPEARARRKQAIEMRAVLAAP